MTDFYAIIRAASKRGMVRKEAIMTTTSKKEDVKVNWLRRLVKTFSDFRITVVNKNKTESKELRKELDDRQQELFGKIELLENEGKDVGVEDIQPVIKELLNLISEQLRMDPDQEELSEEKIEAIVSNPKVREKIK